ncbi:Pcl5p KNAG_0B01960 [Huiozyma naganishii CBS 8797]|uniref:Cyclin N-terminal domain-containing protein n=1 Tax=Huiozyma naganishii (strain ATCC MYA-139 / BCRC 22969 / CBS 8797 / KCTC 17520 / NBRC 10181 / NCYC 3082 / Yp74L-3) TaxID=1071383 RepID=J7RGG6_HUIN7|nr:hypothetical protein KNAG_0B01960 [Kazachstania naganishii CBS 8797]CCK68638.1 hypothetical protein KNAG_0B01960 [Kazachstania naganishii CBS 8797]
MQVTPDFQACELKCSGPYLHQQKQHCRDIYQTPPHEGLVRKACVIKASSNSSSALNHNVTALVSKLTLHPQNKRINNSISSISGFLVEVLKRSKSNRHTTSLASFYFTRLMQAEKFDALPEFAQCAKRVFLICLILAHKFLTDNTFSAETWSKISGLPKKTLSDMERWVLKKLDYNLFVEAETMTKWNTELLSQTTITLSHGLKRYRRDEEQEDVNLIASSKKVKVV